jgi:hypothetical protein
MVSNTTTTRPLKGIDPILFYGEEWTIGIAVLSATSVVYVFVMLAVTFGKEWVSTPCSKQLSSFVSSKTLGRQLK